MAVTTDEYPKPEPVKEEKIKAEDAMKAGLEHNRRLLARAKLVTTNVEAVVLDTTTTRTTSTTSPAAETESITSLHSEGSNTDDVPETNRSTDLMNVEGSEVKANVVEAKNKDEEEHKAEAKGEKLPEAGKEESNAEGNQAEGKEKRENKARRKKAEARRKEGYNKFVVLIEEPEYEKVSDIEEDATTTDEESESGEESETENEQDVEGVEEAASKTEEKPDVNWFDPVSRRKEEEHLEAKAEETATAGKRKEKRKRKKKTKAGGGELDGNYYPSCGVLCVGLACILMFFGFLQVS